MLAAGGLASAGDAVRNWDNARGHHEMLDMVRLDEAVLAYSGGHWLSPPRELRWTDEHEASRDRLLRARIGGKPVLLKDPRTLLALAFWRASPVPFHVLGIVRHPLAVARSLESWRGMPLDDGIALWTAHNRALAADHALYGYPLIDFEQPKPTVVAAVIAACTSFGAAIDVVALAAAFEEKLVHHDDGDAPALAGLDEAVALYRSLAGCGVGARSRFPRGELAAFYRLLDDHDLLSALERSRVALAAVGDAAAVLVPVVTALVRHRAFAETRALISEHTARLDAGLAALLHGKVLLAMGDAAGATPYLEAACAVPQPLFQACQLLPQALRGSGRNVEAREAMQRVVSAALYPHGPLATLAEWSWLDGDRSAAVCQMADAIAAAPLRRRGRLRTRRAEWLIAGGDSVGARVELIRAIEEDPGYARSQEVLRGLHLPK
jgi:hypothetical protein